MYFKLKEIIKNNVEYELLPLQFFILTFWGVWCPRSWTSKHIYFHKLFFILVFILNFIMCVEMLIYFLLSIGTEYYKLTNLFFVSASISGVYKSLKIMINRKSIRVFIKNYFNTQWIKPQDPQETEIHEKINLKIKNISITYFLSMVSIVLMKDLSPLAESGLVIQLPVDAWYPYSIEKSISFCITYLQQVVLGCSVIFAHVGIDTLFVGLLLKASGQINVLRYRLRNLAKNFNSQEGIKSEPLKTRQRKLILQCIHHHERIYRFGEDLNNTFQEMLIILIVSSLPNICINVYALSSNLDNIDMDYIATFFSTTSALIQFFIACWFGNEVSLNSVEVKNAAYEMDWSAFDVSLQKLLIIIMARSSKPIEFSVGYIIPMNIDSFLKIIKASYTAFNLLQQTSN